MRFLAAASSGLRRVLAGPARPAACLGVARGALYLRITEPPGALVLLCQDAVRLPCGLLLPATSAELPFSALASPSASFMVGDHAVRWSGPAGPVVVHAAREWAPRRVARGEVDTSALAAARSALGLGESCSGERQDLSLDRCEFGVARATPNSHSWPWRPCADAQLLGQQGVGAAAAARLLGHGPGLTPAGDDVLAGFLVGAVAFGLDAARLRDAIADLAAARTTALSAALLWHAARGECIDELAALAAILTGQRSRPELAGAVRRLVSVGHSSGAALALGLLTAAESAVSGSGGLAA